MQLILKRLGHAVFYLFESFKTCLLISSILKNYYGLLLFKTIFRHWNCFPSSVQLRIARMNLDWNLKKNRAEFFNFFKILKKCVKTQYLQKSPKNIIVSVPDDNSVLISSAITLIYRSILWMNKDTEMTSPQNWLQRQNPFDIVPLTTKSL